MLEFAKNYDVEELLSKGPILDELQDRYKLLPHLENLSEDCIKEAYEDVINIEHADCPKLSRKSLTLLRRMSDKPVPEEEQT